MVIIDCEEDRQLGRLIVITDCEEYRQLGRLIVITGSTRSGHF